MLSLQNIFIFCIGVLIILKPLNNFFTVWVTELTYHQEKLYKTHQSVEMYEYIFEIWLWNQS